MRGGGPIGSLRRTTNHLIGGGESGLLTMLVVHQLMDLRLRLVIKVRHRSWGVDVAYVDLVLITECRLPPTLAYFIDADLQFMFNDDYHSTVNQSNLGKYMLDISINLFYLLNNINSIISQMSISNIIKLPIIQTNALPASMSRYNVSHIIITIS